MASVSQDADRTRFIFVDGHPAEAGEYAVAFAGRRATAFALHEPDQRGDRRLAFACGTAEDLTILVDQADLEDRNRRQMALFLYTLPVGLVDQTIGFQFPERSSQPCPVRAAQTEGARDFPLAHRFGIFRDEVDDLPLRRQRRLL